MKDLFDNVNAGTATAPAATPPTPIRRGVNVSLEPDGKGEFWLTRVRPGRSGALILSREEVEELRAQIPVALAFGADEDGGSR